MNEAFPAVYNIKVIGLIQRHCRARGTDKDADIEQIEDLLAQGYTGKMLLR